MAYKDKKQCDQSEGVQTSIEHDVMCLFSGRPSTS